MKKLLIATSAVVGLGLVSANHAAAQVETTLSGLVRVDLSDTGLSNSNMGMAVSRTQIQWNAEGTSDTGLTYGAQLRIRNGATAGQTQTVYFGGGFGQVTLGSNDGAADISNGIEAAGAGTGAVDGAGLFATDVEGLDAITAAEHAGTEDVAAITPVTGHDIDVKASGDVKITYTSPNFNGLTVAVSKGFDSDADNSNDNDEGYDLGVAYLGAFGDTAIGGHFAYANGKEAGTTNDYSEWMLGVNAGFGPITVGATYRKNEENTADTTVAIGAKYNFGPGNVSLNYAMSEDNGAELTSTILSADYTVAPGWVVATDISRNKGEVTGFTAPAAATAELVAAANSSSNTSWVIRNSVSF